MTDPSTSQAKTNDLGDVGKTQHVVPINRSAMGIATLFSTSEQLALAVQLGPNEMLPGHVHVSPEWCFLMRGTFQDNFGTKTAPCFFFHEQGSIHRDIQAGSQGCELYVIKSTEPNHPLE